MYFSIYIEIFQHYISCIVRQLLVSMIKSTGPTLLAKKNQEYSFRLRNPLPQYQIYPVYRSNIANKHFDRVYCSAILNSLVFMYAGLCDNRYSDGSPSGLQAICQGLTCRDKGCGNNQINDARVIETHQSTGGRHDRCPTSSAHVQ